MSKILFIFQLFSFWIKGKDPIFELFMKDKKVLDLGCGEGKLLQKNPNLIYGIDINMTTVEALKKKKLNVERGSVTEIPHEANSFDVVHCSNIIEHLTPVEAQKMFLEIKRVLKKNGIVIIITPMPKTIWNTFGHIKPYPPTSIRKLLRRVSLESFDSVAGLEIQNIFYYGTWARCKFTFVLSTIISNIFPSTGGSYLMAIKKIEN